MSKLHNVHDRDPGSETLPHAMNKCHSKILALRREHCGGEQDALDCASVVS